MTRWDIPNPSPSLPSRVKRVAGSLDFKLTLRTTLATLPGSTHWHFKHPAHKGTIEVTFHPNAPIAWVSTHANRTSPPTQSLAQSLAELLGSCSGDGSD